MIETKRIVGVTIYYFIVKLIMILLWTFGLIGIVSMSDITSELNDNGIGYHKVIEFTNATLGMTVAMVICIIWIVFYIREMTKFVYSIAAA